MAGVIELLNDAAFVPPVRCCLVHAHSLGRRFCREREDLFYKKWFLKMVDSKGFEL
jgi:hypothetical protein